MAGIVDFLYFAITVALFGGAIAGILFVVNRISEFTASTKEKLKSQGYNISDKGVEVHTEKRFNHEDYVDATQRGLLKAMGASTFGKANSDGSGSGTNKLKAPEQTVKKSRSGLLRRKSDNK